MKSQNGRKRPRGSRVLLKNPAPTLIDSNGQLIRRRGHVVRLAIAAVSVVLCTLVVFGWGPPGRRLAGGYPFTYRLGMRPNREIRVMVHHFRKPNPGSTNA